MHTIIISLPARADISHNYNYLRELSPNSALRFFDATRTTFAEIARNPEIGRKYFVTNPRLQDLRKWQVSGFRKYLIFYRIEKTSVEILRILHGTQDLERILNEE
jgi:toxin ParE1/3/4